MRWLVRLAATVMVGVLLLATMVLLMPKDGVAHLAASRFATATGHQMTISGPFQPRIWPVMGVRTGPISVANADWGSAPEMLTAEAMDIGLNLTALLNGRLQITAIRLKDAELVIERAPEGHVNWQVDTPPEKGAFGLASLAIRNGTVHVFDQVTGADLHLGGLRADMAIPDLAGPVQLSFEAEDTGAILSGAVTIADLARFLSEGLADVTLDLATGQSTLRFTGAAGLSPVHADGRIEADLADLPAVYALMGWAAPASYPADVLGLKGRFVMSEGGALHLRGAELLADGAKVTGDLDWSQGPDRPKVAAKLALGAVKLPLGLGEKAAGAWSETPVDAAALGWLDANVALTAQSLTVGPLKFGETFARVQIDDRRAVVTLAKTAAYGGTVEGQVVANDRNGFSLATDLRFKGMELQPLLHDTTGLDPLKGRGDLQLKLLGAGQTEAAIMQSLAGEARLSMGKGELQGIDIVGMLRSMDPGYVAEGKRTPFEGLSFGLAIRDGVAQNPDLAVTSDEFVATGAGKVDIGQRAFAYRLLPRLLPKSDGTGGIEVPVLISGPWAGPEVRLDLEWLSKQRSAAEKARSEELAKKRLEELAAEPAAAPAE